MEKIKAVRIMKPGELRIVEEEMPHIDEANNVLVKVKASGLCDFREAQSGFDFNDTHDPPIRKIVFTLEGEPYKVRPDQD